MTTTTVTKLKIGKNEYQCENCKEVFTKTWTDEEAEAEANSLWGEELLKGNPAVVCDDCFYDMTEAVPPREFIEEHLSKN